MPDPSDAIALLRQYLDAHYRVELAGERLLLRVGEPVTHPRLQSGQDFAFITAWNPGSMAQPPAVNETAQHGLEGLLAAAGAVLYPAVSGCPGGSWHEGSAFAVGIKVETADGLAARFEQNAIVAGRIGEPARLRIYRVEWKAAAAAAGLDTRWIDWVASPAVAGPPAH